MVKIFFVFMSLSLLAQDKPVDPDEYAKEIRRIHAEAMQEDLRQPKLVVEEPLPAPCPLAVSPQKANKAVKKPAPVKKAGMLPDDPRIIFGAIAFLALAVSFLLGRVTAPARMVYYHPMPPQF